MGPTGHKQDFPSLPQAPPPTPGNLMQAAGKAVWVSVSGFCSLKEAILAKI